ncbi:MAG: hypothetical protein AABM31_04690 [Actinomycetota bacterium]
MRSAALIGLPVALAGVLAVASPASADLDTLKAACEASPRDAADNAPGNGVALGFYFCDDEVPTAGGREPNPGGVRAIEVPAAYQGHIGLPPKDTGAAAAVPGNSAGNVALDADLSFPDPAKFPAPAGG